MHAIQHPAQRRCSPFFGVAACSLLLVGLVGCTEADDSGPAEQPPGALQLSWNITVGDLSCEDAGIANVAIQLSYQAEIVATATVPCGDYQAQLEDVPPGTYTLTVTGLDASAKAIYRARQGAVTVRTGATTLLGDVELEQLQGMLKISWYFANGRTCAINEVQSIKLTVFDVALQRAIPLETSVFDCNYNDIYVMQEVPPGSIKVIGSGLKDGAAAFHADLTVTATSGVESPVELRLEACAQGGHGVPGC